MLDEPLREADARALIRRIIEDGEVEFWPHAPRAHAEDLRRGAVRVRRTAGGRDGLEKEVDIR